MTNGGQHSTEEAFALPTQPSRVQISAPLSEWTANKKKMRLNPKKMEKKWDDKTIVRAGIIIIEKRSSGFLEAKFFEENLSPAENRKQLIFDARIFCRVKVKVGQKKNFQLLDF